MRPSSAAAARRFLSLSLPWEGGRDSSYLVLAQSRSLNRPFILILSLLIPPSLLPTTTTTDPRLDEDDFEAARGSRLSRSLALWLFHTALLTPSLFSTEPTARLLFKRTNPITRSSRTLSTTPRTRKKTLGLRRRRNPTLRPFGILIQAPSRGSIVRVERRTLDRGLRRRRVEGD